MLNLFVSSTLVLILALLALAWDATRTERNPLIMLAGLALVLLALSLRLFSGAALGAILLGLLADTGLALLVLALFLSFRRRGRREGVRTTALLGLSALLLAFLLQTAGRMLFRNASGPAEPTSLLVELGPDDRLAEIASVLEAHGVQHERAFPEISLGMDEDLAQVYLLHGTRDALEGTAETLTGDRENVDHLEWNTAVHLEPPRPSRAAARAPERRVWADDPLVASQWGLTAVRGHEAHALLRRARPVRRAVVAIIDTGVDARHEDLQAAFRESPGPSDGNGHGTHCAGLAGAVAHNGLGVASLNWEGRFVEVASFPALSAGGVGTVETIAQAILDAARAGVDVISLSLGEHRPIPPRVVAEAVDFALRRGAIVVASAGNAGRDARSHMPSNLEGVIAVAAVDQDLRKARFSNTVGGLSRPLAAPGVDILSLKPNGDYVSLSGTSMATPFVAGLLGVLRALRPELTAAEAYGLLHRTGRELEETDQIGRLIDAEAALRGLGSLRSPEDGEG